MPTDRLTLEWEAADGYVSGRRPQKTKLDVEDFEGYGSREEVERLVWEVLQEDFLGKVTAEPRNLDEVVDAIWERIKDAD